MFRAAVDLHLSELLVNKASGQLKHLGGDLLTTFVPVSLRVILNRNFIVVTMVPAVRV
jgi:hypothetical protein